MHSFKVTVSNNDVDSSFKIKVPALYRYFQDAALFATQSSGVDSISLARRNIDWVITRMDVEIMRLPDCNEELTIHTYPGKDLAFFYPRFFYITDSNDKVIVRASSLWALIDNTTRKMISDREVIKKLPQETSPYELPLPSRIPIPEEKSLIEKRKIHYHDLDFNSHMNNVRYVELLLDTHDKEFYREYRPSFISLNYMREIKEKEIVSVYTDNNDPETIIVEVDDNLSFLGKVTFVPR